VQINKIFAGGKKIQLLSNFPYQPLHPRVISSNQNPGSLVDSDLFPYTEKTSLPQRSTLAVGFWVSESGISWAIRLGKPPQ